MPPLCFAYYCSGHGYGHATRVSAFVCHLLNLPSTERPTVYITSSAPKHVFSDSIALGALYRYAEIDPVIVQPLAYRVDRQKSVDVLKSFISRKNTILETERRWLNEIGAHAVLSDAAFMGCLSANASGIPSVLITNFTFDSVYSYLATPLLQVDLEASSQPDHLTLATPKDNLTALVPDIPVPSAEIDPLVAHIYEGYRCADLLFLLPGCIPIPSFPIYPSLPAPSWVNPYTNSFHSDIIESLSRLPPPCALHPSIPLQPSSLYPRRGNPTRSVVAAPLLVRPPSTTYSPYTPEGRARLLSTIGVPSELHDPTRTKVLIVSFGGQVFRAPSRPSSRSQSRSNTPSPSPTVPSSPPSFCVGSLPTPQPLKPYPAAPPPPTTLIPPRLATPSHIWIPGAPPAHKRGPSAFSVPDLATIPPTPDALKTAFNITPPSLLDEADPFDPQLLPDESWIAIVCGASKDKWSEDDKATGLPDGFYVAPRDVYMPDLTAVGDALLGKLGYGTVSECVDACTPFVYVSRPLFIEEHGLRLLLDREGVGIELSRQSYEAGDWAVAVEEAYVRGREAKETKRANAQAGIGMDDKRKEGLNMARKVVAWTHDWWTVKVAN
ncbi:hypothetical protein DXG01_008504 [Tephrocybe rancida]|nr:hypothetical protein DXG01_008504 [Tephrocybe rancida]